MTLMGFEVTSSRPSVERKARGENPDRGARREEGGSGETIRPQAGRGFSRVAILTEDGKEVGPGDRVFDYYDGHWGTIGDDIDSEGWFTHHREDGGRGLLNGQRVTTQIPPGNPFYKSHGRRAKQEPQQPREANVMNDIIEELAEEENASAHKHPDKYYKKHHHSLQAESGLFTTADLVGQPYGSGIGEGSPAYITGDGVNVWMYRGPYNKTRFYDIDGNQVGPEQANVAPAVAYALSNGWRDPAGAPNIHPNDPIFGDIEKSASTCDCDCTACARGDHAACKSCDCSGTTAARKTAAEVSPGYYVVSRNGGIIAGPFDTISQAEPSLIQNRGAAIEYKSGQPFSQDWASTKAKPFPYSSNTVNG